MNASFIGYTLWFTCRPDLRHIEQTGSRSATQRRNSLSPCATHNLCGSPGLFLKQRGHSLVSCCIQKCSKQESQKLRPQPMQQRTSGTRKSSSHTAQQESSTPSHEMSTSICEIQCSTDGPIAGSQTYIPDAWTECTVGVQLLQACSRWDREKDTAPLVSH